MDIATHMLLGASCGYVVGQRTLKRSAAVLGAIGAAFPDLDVFLQRADDPLFTLEYHRHFLHSMTAAIIATCLLAYLAWRFIGRGQLGTYLLIFATSYTSAIMLDACTSYGTLVFWPFSDQRIALSIISIIDPLFSVALLIALLWGLLRGSRVIVGLGLVLCAGYLGFAALQQHRANDLLARTVAKNFPDMQRTLTKPSFANTVLWRGLMWNDDKLAVVALRPGLLTESRVYDGEQLDRPNSSDLANWAQGSATQARDVTRFQRLSENLLVQHPQSPNMLGDARFSLLPNSLEPLWGIVKNDQQQNSHVQYVTKRDLSPRVRSQFIHMLLGRR